MSKRAAFLDRDGTVVEEVNYLTRDEQLRLEPGAAGAMRRLREAGYLLILITNQSGVARGMLTEEELARVHRRLGEMLSAVGAELDGTYYCPHLPGAEVGEYDLDCACRKPKPGMILKAAEEHGVDLAASVMFGDSERDVESGKEAGCRAVLIHHGDEPEETRADYSAKDLAEGVDALLAGRLASAP